MKGSLVGRRQLTAGGSGSKSPQISYPIQRLNEIEKLLLWIYCLSFAFDFKGPKGGSFVQFAFAVAALSSGFGFCAVSRLRGRRLKVKGELKKIVWLWWVYLCSTVITALLMKTPWSQYVRVFLPFFLFGLSLLIIMDLSKINIDLRQLVSPLFWSSVISIYWSFIYPIYLGNLAIGSIRYQILSTALPFFFAYMLFIIAIGKHASLLKYATLMFGLTMVFLSITRTYVIILALLSVGYLMIIHRDSLTKKIRQIKRIIIVTFLVGVLAIVGVALLRPNTFQEWHMRIFIEAGRSGLDTTFLTRLAEYSGQWQALKSDVTSLLFGKGMGSSFEWDSAYFADLISQVALIRQKGYVSHWYAGHSTWVYSLYSGGILFGWIVPFTLLLSLYKSFHKAGQSRQVPFKHSGQYAVLSFFVIMSYVGDSFTANIFGSRLSAIIVGFSCGMAFWPYHGPALRSKKSEENLSQKSGQTVLECLRNP